MERRIRVSLARIIGAMLLTFAFLVCSNPIDIVGNVTNEVKASHNMFLIVSNVSPTANTTVSPGSTVTIKFDRPIDPSTATSDTIAFSPAITWDSSSYDDPSKTLTIAPTMLQGGASYTVTVTTGVKGTDGSTLQANYSWTFSTRAEPYATFKITSPDTTPPHDPAYTRTAGVTIAITPNQLVDQMCIWEDGVGSPGAWEYKSTSKAFTLSSGDGLKKIWMEFTDRDMAFTTTPASHVVTLDTVAPSGVTLAINGGNGLLTNSLSVNLTYSASDANGLYQMQFYNGTYSGWMAYAASYTYSIPSGDGTKTVYVEFGDKAGNISGCGSATINLDQTPPNAPTVSGTASPGTASPSYSWTSGGGGGAGVYRYSVNSISGWSAETTATSVAPSVDYGSNTLYVEERDAASNWSTYGYWSYFYYPSWLRPVYQATNVSRMPTFVFGTGLIRKGTYWNLYIGSNPRKLELLAQNLTTYSYAMETQLASGTAIYWRYTITNAAGTVTYTSPVYVFTTGG